MFESFLAIEVITIEVSSMARCNLLFAVRMCCGAPIIAFGMNIWLLIMEVLLSHQNIITRHTRQHQCLGYLSKLLYRVL